MSSAPRGSAAGGAVGVHLGRRGVLHLSTVFQNLMEEIIELPDMSTHKVLERGPLGNLSSDFQKC